MSKSKRATAPVDPEVLENRHRAKAAYYRKVLAQTGTLTDKQREFLVKWDLEHADAPGAKATKNGPRLTVDDLPKPAQPEEPAMPSAGAGAPAGDAPPPSDPPAAPVAASTPPPAPPKVAAKMSPPPAAKPAGRVAPPPPPVPPALAQAIGPDWRAEFGGGGAGADRRAVCVEAASYWQAALIAMADQITESGGDPIFDPRREDVAKALVLACDELIPPHVKITPKVHAAVVTTSLMAQRLFRAGKLREVREQKERNARMVTKLHAVPPPPAAPTAPTPVIDGAGTGRASPDPTPAAVSENRTEPAKPVLKPVPEDDPIDHNRGQVTRNDSPFAGKPIS